MRSFWFDESASILDYLKYFLKRKGIKIGIYSTITLNKTFLSPYFKKYKNIMASTRLRVNDFIFQCLNNKEINARFYNPFIKYDILLFQKVFSEKPTQIASKYKKKERKVILDLNVNYFEKNSKTILKQQTRDIQLFINYVDLIITTTDYLRDYIIKNKIFSNVETIPEIISNQFFTIKKKHTKKEKINLLYVGYAIKAKELELIKNEIEKLNKIYDVNLILICERKPEVNIKIRKKFVKYDQSRLHYDMIKGDIFLNPRDLSNPYNLGHSFTKIGYPMSIGIPVLASPVPSYLKSPVILCKNNSDWFNKIERLINDYELRNDLSKKGIEYCKQNFSTKVIIDKYIEIFKRILRS